MEQCILHHVSIYLLKKANISTYRLSTDVNNNCTNDLRCTYAWNLSIWLHADNTNVNVLNIDMYICCK